MTIQELSKALSHLPAEADVVFSLPVNAGEYAINYVESTIVTDLGDDNQLTSRNIVKLSYDNLYEFRSAPELARSCV